MSRGRKTKNLANPVRKSSGQLPNHLPDQSVLGLCPEVIGVLKRKFSDCPGLANKLAATTIPKQDAWPLNLKETKRLYG
jgi:hypothetical protein